MNSRERTNLVNKTAHEVYRIALTGTEYESEIIAIRGALDRLLDKFERPWWKRLFRIE